MLSGGRQLVLLHTDVGTAPFEKWFQRLVSWEVRRSVLVKISRLQNPGFKNFKSVGGGICELRIFEGPGYRIYFALFDPNTLVLILGGDKSQQRKDIRRAQSLWRKFKNETDKHRRKFSF